MKISKTVVEDILSIISKYFANEYEESFITDIGTWKVELTNSEGKVFKRKGCLLTDFYEVDGNDLSQYIRDRLDMGNLMLFDGQSEEDLIERIEVLYKRVTKIYPEVMPEEIKSDHFIWDYDEKLIIDRRSGTIEHLQNVFENVKITRKYEVKDGIESLLNGFEAKELFEKVVGNPSDVVDLPNETKDYEIKVDYRKGEQKVISGSYDKKGLPSDYAKFIGEVIQFIRFYGLGEIFDNSIYEKIRRRASEYIYCSVIFGDAKKLYYYLTNDDTIKVGDFAYVQAGKDNHEAIVKVVKIEYFTSEDAPLPVDKTKSIIRKLTVEEVEELFQERDND